MKKIIASILFLLSFSLTAQAQQVIHEEGEGYHKKTIIAEPAREVLEVRRDGLYPISLRPQLWMYLYKYDEYETGYFVPGCDIVFRNPYDPRWDVFVERTNVYARTEILIELLPGLNYSTALHMQQNGYLTTRPESWAELERELERYERAYNLTIKTHILYAKEYWQTNLINLGAVRPGFELECGGHFVHEVYDYLRRVREPVNDRRHRDIAKDFERNIEIEVQGSELNRRERDRFTIFYDGEVVSVISSHRNSVDYEVLGPDETGEKDYWLITAEAPLNDLDMAHWGRRDAEASVVFDEEASSLFLDFKDLRFDDRDPFRSTIEISIFKRGRRKDRKLLGGWEIDADRNGLIGVDLVELVNNWGSEQMLRGVRYYVKVRYHRVGSQHFGQGWSETQILPSKRGVLFERRRRRP